MFFERFNKKKPVKFKAYKQPRYKSAHLIAANTSKVFFSPELEGDQIVL